MNSPAQLTLAFLEGRPESAAPVLAELDPSDAAAFLESIPGRLAAPVLAKMAPWSAARCLEHLSPGRAATTLQRMPFLDATSLLRLIEEDWFEVVLGQMTDAKANDFRNSLKYPKGTVGAWMDYTVPTFSADTLAADTLKYAKRRDNRADSHIFVDQAGVFAGAVGIGELLRCDRKASLAEIMDRSIRPLSNRAMLASVSALPDWDRYSMLPVVGRKHNVLGGLTRGGLRKGLSEERRSRVARSSESMLTHVFGSLLLSAAGLLEVVTASGDGSAARSSEENDDGR